MRKIVPFILASVAFAIWYGVIVHPNLENFTTAILTALVGN